MLTERQFRLCNESSLEGKLFREGAECEARERRAMHGRHRELVDCAEELANAHQDWTSGDIALALARIFNHTIEEEPV